MTQNLENNTVVQSQDDSIIQLVMTNIPKLVKGKDYFAKDLIGKKVWSTHSTGSKIALGTVISDLAENRRLPIIFAGKTTSNKNLYQLE